MSQTDNPFPSFHPGASSPLSQTQREHSPFVTVANVEEQRRAEGIVSDIQSGARTPIFDQTPTPVPFPPMTPVARPQR